MSAPLTREKCAATPTPWPLDGTYTCNRKVCDHAAQVLGGYCPCCFHRKMTEPFPRPEVVVLCGSTRFTEEFRRQNLRLTLAGKIVLSVGCDTKSDADLAEAGELTEDVKRRLDVLHKRKIDLADRVLVLNVGGYIGDSTRSEIEYAEWYEKPIDYLEPLDGIERKCGRTWNGDDHRCSRESGHSGACTCPCGVSR